MNATIIKVPRLGILAKLHNLLRKGYALPLAFERGIILNIPDILEKFEAVEIKNESRISGEELEFCIAQQKLYSKVLAQHCYVFDVLNQLKADCEVFMQSVVEDNEYHSHGYTYNHYSCDHVKISKKEFVDEHIVAIHKKFVAIIIEHFTKKYNVSIGKPKYERLLGITKPDEPEYSFRGYSISDEEKAEYAARKRTYNDAHEAYLDSIINAELDYNAVLDYIFLKLGGSTFAERAEQEIKDASRKATSSHWGKPEIKNKKISIDILSPRKGWRNEYDVDLSGEGYRAVLRALTYFNSDKRVKEIYSDWYRFTGYTKHEHEGIFDSHHVSGAKVRSFKYYKNGKFEITFDAHTTARQFATEYLYSEEVAEDG